jgi:hypothetical protein
MVLANLIIIIIIIIIIIYFSIWYSNTLSYTIHKVLLYNIGIKKIGNSRLLVFVYNKIL